MDERGTPVKERNMPRSDLSPEEQIGQSVMAQAVGSYLERIHASYEDEQAFEDEAFERCLSKIRDEAGELPIASHRRHAAAVYLLLEGGLDDVVAVDMEYARQAVRIWKRVLGAL
jgi:phosphoglycolate phosphatase-like HAD superfamily hydrolase